jgi:hypothetical protein
MPIKEDHLSNLKVLRVVESVAVERFDEHLLLVVPEGKSVAAGDDCKPLLLRMDCHQSNSLGQVCVKIKDHLVLAGHL